MWRNRNHLFISFGFRSFAKVGEFDWLNQLFGIYMRLFGIGQKVKLWQGLPLMIVYQLLLQQRKLLIFNMNMPFAVFQSLLPSP